jgi:hypothetical protein
MQPNSSSSSRIIPEEPRVNGSKVKPQRQEGKFQAHDGGPLQPTFYLSRPRSYFLSAIAKSFESLIPCKSAMA